MKKGPTIRGSSPKTFGLKLPRNHHHFLFSAMMPSTKRKLHINKAPGRNRLNDLVPINGTESQGKITINGISFFALSIL
jgi:hypothetical protein